MSTETLTGRYHPDPEVNDGIAADVLAGEEANLRAGFPPSPWECECGAQHNRGHTTLGVHRCMRCGEHKTGGRLMDPSEWMSPEHDYTPSEDERRAAERLYPERNKYV